jgi:hypothetical protein
MHKVTGATALFLASLIATPAFAEDRPSPFDAGKMRLSIGMGTVRDGNDTGFTLGVGAGYYVIDGLEVGLETDYTFGVPNDRLAVSPGVRYVAHMVPVIKPYVGAFYRRWVVDAFDDFSTVGVRAGAFYVSRGGTFIGGGVVHEVVLDGPDGLEDPGTYPEIVLSVVF